MAEPVQAGAPGEGADPSEEVQEFHLFSKLPPELRIKIWKAACLPRSPLDHGIHYVFVNRVRESEEIEDDVTWDPNLEGYNEEFDVESDDTAYVTLRALKRERPKPRVFASGYLYDAGLWAACKESRGAITEYLQIERWETLRESGPRDMSPGWYDKPDFPSTVKPSTKDETWRPIVAPRQDIFCIPDTRRMMQSLPKSLYSMKLLAPFMGTRRFTIVEDMNIALKFRHTWNTKFPDDIENLKQEKTPRGLLANWFERFHDEILPEPTLYVIDDTGSWVEPPFLMRGPVYRDCDNEYVEVPWSASCNGTNINTSGTAGRFIDLMEGLLQEDFSDDFEDMDSIYEWQPEVRDKIRLLVRKENEIMREPGSAGGTD